MAIKYKILDPKDFADSFSARDAFALETLVGLSDPDKYLPSKFLYDKRGSELFEKITQLPEYYLTNCERDILRGYAKEIAEYMKDEPFNLVELGAGVGEKTRVLLKEFQEQGLSFEYVPIDISEGAMNVLIDDMNKSFPDIETNGLVSDYFNGLKWLNNRYKRKNFVLFLGSSIGNFTPAESKFFMRNMWSCLNHGDCALIGFDLKKDIELLLWAYNDSQGVTAEFNLNLLRRINDELGGTFDLDKFRHYGTYNVFTGAMESYLVSMREQTVYVDMIGRSFGFRAWEPIRTESSFKYLESDIHALAGATGFGVKHIFFDERHFFSDAIYSVVKPPR